MPFVIEDAPVPAGEDALNNVAIPHFQFPFTMVNTNGNLTASVVEQDSLDEIMACTQAICTCPVGARGDTPNFGIPNQLFANAPVDTAAITNAITYWEPRAATVATEYPDLMSDAIRHVNVTVSPQQTDQ